MIVTPKGKAKTDTIILEVIRHCLESIPNQIEIDITRTAYSPSVYDYKDFAVGLVDIKGRLICQGNGGIPLFLANVLGLAAEKVLEYYPQKDLKENDAVISNHAPTFGQHLNNVVMLTPIFDKKNQLFGFFGVVVHWLDIGGKAVGSHLVNDTTEIFQEGIQFNCVKLISNGTPVAEIYRMIEANSRFPVQLIGDVNSQVAGCMKGSQLVKDVLEKYGRPIVQKGVDKMWQQSASSARSAVRSIPDGVYSASSVFDNDGIDLNKPIHIDLQVIVKRSQMIIDFSNVSDQVLGPFNSGKFGGGITAARIAFKYLTTPNESMNEGSFEPLKVILPPGKFLSAGPTAALAKYSTPLPTVIDTIIYALSKAIPQKVTAGHHSDMGSHRFSGINPRDGRPYLTVNTANGGWGASDQMDGASPFKTLAHGDTQDIPTESIEALYPLLMLAKFFRIDSGGVGKNRGGLGVTKEYLALSNCKLTLTFDRQITPPWGLFGGKDGALGYAEVIKKNRTPQSYLKVDQLELAKGDIVRVHSGGGGGFGDGFQRDIKKVEVDLMNEYISKAAAEKMYGLRFAKDGSIDIEGTVQFRQKIAQLKH